MGWYCLLGIMVTCPDAHCAQIPELSEQADVALAAEDDQVPLLEEEDEAVEEEEQPEGSRKRAEVSTIALDSRGDVPSAKFMRVHVASGGSPYNLAPQHSQGPQVSSEADEGQGGSIGGIGKANRKGSC